MNGDGIEFQDNILTNINESRNMELVENANEINSYDYDNFQPNQQYAVVLSSNNNNNDGKLESYTVADDYYTLHTDLQQQPTNPTNEHCIKSDITFEQNGRRKLSSFENETPKIEHSKVPMHSKNYTSSQQAQEQMMSMQEHFKRFNECSTAIKPIYRSDNPINSSICVQSENSNPTFANDELGVSYSADYNPDVQQQQQRQQQKHQKHQKQQKQQHEGNMQTESINSVLAHQWRQRREKLPITPLDATFYTEWQINRPQVVNTAEIQKRKLLFFQRKTDEQLAPVNQPNASSTPEQLKKPRRKQKQKQQQLQPCNSQEQQQQQQQLQPCNSQEQQQQQQLQPRNSLEQQQQLQLQPRNSLEQQQLQLQPRNSLEQQQQQLQLQPRNSQEQQLQQFHQAQHLYRLHQMQQQHNHLRSPTSDSRPSPRQFTHSPASLNSSTVSANQLPPQMLSYIQSTLSPQIQLEQPFHLNNDNSNCNPMLPQQQQQQLMLQMLQQQQLQQQLVQYYQTTMNSNFFGKWEKLNQQQYQEALQENVVRHKGANTSRRQTSKKRKRQNLQQEIGDDKENASVNSSDPPLVIDESIVEPSNDEKIVKNDAEPTNDLQSAVSQSGLWQNNYAMLQDWLHTQQQDVGQQESDIVQYGNAE